MKRINFALLLVCFIALNLILVKEGHAAESTHYGQDSQAISVDVFNEGKESQTYVYWYQMDNGDFRAEGDHSGYKYASPLGGYPNWYPVKTTVTMRLDYKNYIAANKWMTPDAKQFDTNYVSNITYIGPSYKSNGITKFEMDGQNHVFMYTNTGGSTSSWDEEASCFLSSDLRPYPVKKYPYPSSNHKKVHCQYGLAFQLEFKGVVTESKKIDATIAKAEIFVDESTKAKAGVSTRLHANASMGSPVDVTSNSQTTWTSSKSAVATVDKYGNVKGISPGTANICANWTRAFDNTVNWDLDDCVTVTVKAGDGEYLTIEYDAPACIQEGEKTSFKINVSLTKKDGSKYDLSTGHSKLSFTTSDNSISKVYSNGNVSISGMGNVTITIKFVDTEQKINVSETITFTIEDCDKREEPGDPDEPGGPPGGETPPGGGTPPAPSCTVTIQPGGTANTMNAQLLTVTPEGKIESQTGEFDVIQGIPSSELLRTEVETPEYMFEQLYEQQRGKVVYSITVTKTFNLSWTIPGTPGNPGPPPTPGTPAVPMSETVTQAVTVEVVRDYSYWNVSVFDIWTAYSALIENYALPNGESLMMYASPITADATQSLDPKSHVFPSICPIINLPSSSINGGSSRPSVPDFTAEAKSAAESAVKAPDVKNDKATLKGNTLMSDALTSGGHGPTPSNVPMPSKVILEKNNLLIDPLKTNYWQSPSEGLMTYKGVFGLNGTPAQKDIPFDVNVVTVHTPVVIYARATDDKEHDQRINPPKRSTPANPDTDRHAFILDRPFTVTLPTNGQHRNIPGYGNRDYAKYTKSKQVRFPFDVYSETKQAFYPANTWIEVPVGMKDVTFFLPVWVTEGEYTIDYRVFAINALPSGDFGGHEEEANITIPNSLWNVSPAGTLSAAHTAIDSIEVDVVGRLYDFQVTDIEDYNWQDVFRDTDGITPSGKSYFVGLNSTDGDKRGNENPFVLPVSHASHPSGIKNLAVKKGYDFKFNFKTKGDMQSLKDAIRIKPRFYFVNTDGTNRQEVDLYYHTNNKKFIKIGSEADKTYREVVLNEPSRNVDMNEIANNAYHYYDFADRFNLTELKDEHTRTSFARNYTKFLSREKIQTGPYGWQILNWNLRTYRGPLDAPNNTMIPKEEIVTKEQTWYGEYSIPASTYVVPKDSKINEVGRVSGLNDNHPIFLKDGYIIVNFDIETINEGDLENPYLSYYNAYYMSQWTDMEGFQPSFTDHYGNVFNSEEGDVIYYYGDQSSLDDFSSSVTH